MLFLSGIFSMVQGQNSITQMRALKLEQVYNTQFKLRTILSGKTFTSAYSHIGGHQFFLDYYEDEGYFIYDGIQYDNQPFRYDIYNQEVIVKIAAEDHKMSTISIDKKKITEFKSDNAKFIRYENETLPESFYQIAYNGAKSKLLIQHTKKVKKLTKSVGGKLRLFVTKNHYFIVINNSATEIKSKKDLVKLFHKNQSLIDYAKKLSIRFKKDGFEEMLIMILTYYDEL